METLILAWDFFRANVAPIIAIFAMVAAATPNVYDDHALAILQKVVNVLGLNVGGAKNAEADSDRIQ